MRDSTFSVVTGAFGFTGRYIAHRLLDLGHSVRTLTNRRACDDPLQDRVDVRPIDFDDVHRLTESLTGASVLYNTYWMRFADPVCGYDQAVTNSSTLFRAAASAGVPRIVHISVANASEDSSFPYFSGKGRVELTLKAAEIPCTILRPALIFGLEDILINNIAWLLRRAPIFGVFGDGQYRVQPIHVGDLAALAVAEGCQTGLRAIDAVGPETFTYRELVAVTAQAIGKVRPIISIPSSLGYAIGRLAGFLQKDIVITRNEIGALVAGLLCTNSSPVAATRFTEWAATHAASLGVRYAHELARRRY